MVSTSLYCLDIETGNLYLNSQKSLALANFVLESSLTAQLDTFRYIMASPMS
jgi:hypothetical protein